MAFRAIFPFSKGYLPSNSWISSFPDNTSFSSVSSTSLRSSVSSYSEISGSSDVSSSYSEISETSTSSSRDSGLSLSLDVSSGYKGDERAISSKRCILILPLTETSWAILIAIPSWKIPNAIFTLFLNISFNMLLKIPIHIHHYHSLHHFKITTASFFPYYLKNPRRLLPL